MVNINSPNLCAKCRSWALSLPQIEEVTFQTKRIIQFTVFTLIGIGLMYAVWQMQADAYDAYCQENKLSNCSLSYKLAQDFKSCHYGLLAIACGIFMISNVLRALQWNQLLESLSYQPRLSTSFYCVMIGYFTNIIPPRIGEFLKSAFLSRYERIPYEKVFGTVLLSRIVDMLFFVLFLALSVVIFADDMMLYIVDKLNITWTMMITLVIAGVLGFASFILVIWWLQRYETENTILLKLKNIIIGFHEGLTSLGLVRQKFLFFGYSLGVWCCYVVMHYFALLAFPPTAHYNMMDALLVFIFGALGMIVPSPGGMGSYHALIVEALQILGLDAINGFSFAMIAFFTLNLFCNVLFGVAGFILLPLQHRREPK